MTKSASPPRVHALVNAHTILTYLGKQKAPAGVNEIARGTGLSPSSCFNLLKTLVDLDLAAFDAVTKQYELGMGVLEIGRYLLSADRVLDRAQPLLRKLAADFDAAAGLWRQSGNGRTVLIANAESQSATRIHMAVGQRFPVAAGAVGRAFLSRWNWEETRVQQAFAEVRWRKDFTLRAYLRDLEQARDCGFGTDREQLLPGLTSLAAVVPDCVEHGSLHYALSVTCFSASLSAGAARGIGAALLDAATSLAER